MTTESGEKDSLELLMKAASYFLAGFFLLVNVFPSNMYTIDFRGWIAFGAGVLLCLFGFLLSITAVPFRSSKQGWINWKEKMKSWSKEGSSFLFAIVVLQLIRYIFVYKDIETLWIISIVFLILFSILFVVTLVIKSSVFQNIKSNLLFIITIAIFAMIIVLTEEVDTWGVLIILMIILGSSINLWYLEKKREKQEKESK